MSITFKKFCDGETKIREHVGYVTGWMIVVNNDGERFEILFARHNDCRVKVSEPLTMNQPEFNKPGRKWSDEPNGVPMDAEFIGYYKADMF